MNIGQPAYLEADEVEFVDDNIKFISAEWCLGKVTGVKVFKATGSEDGQMGRFEKK